MNTDTERAAKSSLPKHVVEELQKGHLNYSYKGISTLKCPFDLALYSLLIWNLKPKTIFEIGSNRGGSALWLADQLRAYGIDGRVWSYDLNPVTEVSDPLVTFCRGDAGKLEDILPDNVIGRLPRPFLVIEDSSHLKRHSRSVLEFFNKKMMPGEYIIVEDGIVIDLGIADDFEGGPALAIQEFMAENSKSWMIDPVYCDFFGYNVTWNINGYLKKIL